MEMCKIDAGMMSIHKIDSDPGQVVADVVSLMHSKALDNGLKLSAACRGPIPQVIRTDPMRLRQILINLIDNAIKFTDEGHVEVTIEMVTPASSQQPGIRFCVEDTGMGMAGDQLERIFLPFAQADDSTDRYYGGTGLGLTISRQLADMLGGQLAVISQPHQGSTFTLEIPTGSLDSVAMVDQLPQLVLGPTSKLDTAIAKNMPDHKGRLDGLRILLVEDRTEYQLLLSVILKSGRRPRHPRRVGPGDDRPIGPSDADQQRVPRDPARRADPRGEAADRSDPRPGPPRPADRADRVAARRRTVPVARGRVHRGREPQRPPR